ncbi:hypothetical protein ACJX0J_008420, partial [Zea mays]
MSSGHLVLIEYMEMRQYNNVCQWLGFLPLTRSNYHDIKIQEKTIAFIHGVHHMQVLHIGKKILFFKKEIYKSIRCLFMTRNLLLALHSCVHVIITSIPPKLAAAQS